MVAAHSRVAAASRGARRAWALTVMEKALFGAYLKRLGLTARPLPGLPGMADLVARHMRTIPFENLDVVAGTTRPLSTDEALRKVVVQGRGGFCYELNEAFRALLDHLGFHVRRIEARVWQPAAEKFGAPFDHLALVVSLAEGEFLVDVGFGDNNRHPLRLPEDHVRDISGEYHLAPVNVSRALPPSAGSEAKEGPLRRSFAVSADRLCLRSASRPLYEMTLAAQPLEAFATMCHYHQTSPESIFAKGLICTRATATGRVTLSGTRLTLIEGGRRTETLIGNPAVVLEHYFGIRDAGINSFPINDIETMPAQPNDRTLPKSPAHAER